MKKVFLGILFSSVSAFTCPDLAGTYTCGYDQNSGEPKLLHIQQVDMITFKVLTFGSNEESTFVADGRLLTLEDDTNFYTFLTVCAPGANALQFTANIASKIESSTQRISSTYLKTSSSTLDFTLQFDLKTKDQDSYFSTTYHCNRN